MKRILPLLVAAAALAATPMLAAADYCSPKKKFKSHGYYDDPYYRPHHNRMPAYRPYPPRPMPYWHGDKYHGRDRAGAPAEGGQSPEAGNEETRNLVDTAISAGSFNTLVEALKQTGLDQKLQGPGVYTVFAPSDEAFRKIPESIRTAITGDKQALTDLLTYHVLSGEVTAADFARLRSAETVQGTAVMIDSSRGITVDGAKVITADIGASNGIIHVIDAVMIPN